LGKGHIEKGDTVRGGESRGNRSRRQMVFAEKDATSVALAVPLLAGAHILPNLRKRPKYSGKMHTGSSVLDS
jgi:hypothetical protein